MHEHAKVVNMIANNILQLIVPNIDKLPVAVFDSRINENMKINSPTILHRTDEFSFRPVDLCSNLTALTTSLVVTLLEGEIIIDGIISEGQQTDIRFYLSQDNPINDSQLGIL